MWYNRCALMLGRHAREARAQARQRSRAPRRGCKPRHVLLVALPTSLAGLVGLWKYTSIARRRPTTTAVLPAAAVPLPAVVPFVVLFESSSGSSWLMQELSALPEVCAIGFEPIDNISMASAADHTLRLRWLRTLWTPQRGSASEWLDWQAALQRASVFGQDDAIRRSLAGCRRADAVAYGLKARLSRLLSDEPSMVRVAALMAEQRVRVVRLLRRRPGPPRRLTGRSPCPGRPKRGGPVSHRGMTAAGAKGRAPELSRGRRHLGKADRESARHSDEYASAKPHATTLWPIASRAGASCASRRARGHACFAVCS